MASEWPTVPLGQLIEPGRALTYGVVQPGPYVPDGVPIVRVADVRDGRVSTSGALRVSPEIEAPYGRSRLRGGELLLTVVGTVGETVVAPDSLAGWNTARGVAVIPVRGDVGAQWVRLALQTPEARGAIDSRLNTTVQATLNLDDVARLPIPMPPTKERQRILRHIGALDDKIELNRRMSQTLESMARALFKSWFVHFDPVRAKAEAREVSVPQALADLFPESFEDSELGELPSGWRVASLGDISTSPRRPVRPNEIDPVTPYMGLEHMPRKSITLAEWGESRSVDSGKTAFVRGEILFGKLRPYFHKVGVAPTDGVCSTDIVVVAPKGDAWFGIVLMQTSSDEFVDYTHASSTGTKMPRTSWSDMARFPLVVPPTGLAASFTDQVRPAVDRIVSSIHEMRTLSTVRDSLLPSLISGQSRLKQSERRQRGPDA